MIVPKIPRKKNQDNFFTAIFIDCINCRIVGEAREVTNLKGIGFWGQTDNLFLHQLISYSSFYTYRQSGFFLFESRGIDLAMNGVTKINPLYLSISITRVLKVFDRLTYLR